MEKERESTVTVGAAVAVVKGSDLQEDPLDHVVIPLSPLNFRIVFTCFALAVFLIALDTTIVSTAIPAIATEFASLDQIAWIGSGFFLTSTSFSPIYGSMCDIFGRKPTFLAGIIIFEIGSLMCGLAPSMVVLILGRIVAGVGGGGVFSVVLIMISDVVSIRDSGKYQGVIGAVFGLSSVLGPLLGGIFTDNISWRWCFYINLPIGFISATAIYFLLDFPSPEGSIKEKLKRVDYLGTFLIVAATTCLLIAVQFGGSTWAWGDAKTISLLVLGFVLLGVFSYVEKHYAHEPILPASLYSDRSVAISLLIAFLLGCVFISLFFYVPVYFQLVNNETATIAGLESIPMIFGLVVFSIVSGVLISMNGRYKYWFFVGSIITVVGLALVSTLNPSTPRGLEVFYLLILGSGVGCVIQVRIYAVQTSVPRELIAVSTAASNFYLNLGGTLGLAMTGTIFNNALNAALGPELAKSAASDPIGVRNLPNAKFVIQSISDSLGKTYYFGLPCAALIFVAALFLKEKLMLAPKSDEEEVIEDDRNIVKIQ